MDELSEVEDIAVFLTLITHHYDKESRVILLHTANEVANRMNRMSDEAKREILQASIVMRQSFPGNSLLIIDDED